MRGTGPKAPAPPHRRRFIPACAGNRDQPGWGFKRITVHPRVCGEQRARSNLKHDVSGSSPRVRGTGPDHDDDIRPPRFIPACAGNRTRGVRRWVRLPVHPRVCGEQGPTTMTTFARRGSSPRVRGTGLVAFDDGFAFRFIPACAGNSATHHRTWRGRPVHPRVCGEQISRAGAASGVGGSSPRVRGTDIQDGIPEGSARFIPACAGNRCSPLSRSSATAVHPRVCGEQVQRSPILTPSGGSSPRVRGTGLLRRLGRGGLRFIPACAGNSSDSARASVVASVHPRVCGEQRGVLAVSAFFDGSSPRVRGTARGDLAHLALERFIPACAGNST